MSAARFTTLSDIWMQKGVTAWSMWTLVVKPSLYLNVCIYFLSSSSDFFASRCVNWTWWSKLNRNREICFDKFKWRLSNRRIRYCKIAILIFILLRIMATLQIEVMLLPCHLICYGHPAKTKNSAVLHLHCLSTTTLHLCPGIIHILFLQQIHCKIHCKKDLQKAWPKKKRSSKLFITTLFIVLSYSH